MSPKIITLKDEGYRIRLARSPQDDPKVKYRKEAERRAESGQFSIPARRLLRLRRQELGISDAEAEAIEAEVLQPFQEYQHKQQVYEETLHECLQAEATLSPNAIKDLMDLRNHLGLKTQDVVAIDQELLGISLENYQSVTEQQREERAQAQRIEKLQLYREGFIKAIEAGYPLDEYVKNGLNQFQQQLELSDAVISAVEQPIRDLAEAKYQELLRVGEEDMQKQKAEIKAEAKAANVELSQQDGDDLRSEKFGANYYAKLRDLLAAQDWKTADQETIERMLEVMGRLKLGTGDERLIKTFPCLDLHNIDRLWIKYSMGKFGFSIQKKIWKSCGSPASYNKSWERFGDFVGWKDPNGWLGWWSWYSKSKYIYTFKASMGHLPSHKGWVGEKLVRSDNPVTASNESLVKGTAHLFSRMDTCNIY